MCLKPISIENPNFNHPLKDTDYGLLHNCVDSHLEVPCGHCSVCIALKQAYCVQRMQMESLDNLLFVGMVSYNNSSMPSIDVNGYNIRYADGTDISNMMRHIRISEELPSFRYFAVSEFGGKTHRPHWHFVVSIPKSFVADKYGRVHLHDCRSLEEKLWSLFLKYWRRNYGARRFPDWKPLLTYKCVGNKRNYDLSFIDTISGNCEDAAFYVTKYSTKYDKYTDSLKSALYFNLPDDQFLDVWKKVKPRTQWSKGFGDPKNPAVAAHVRKGIDLALRNNSILPLFINPNTGQTFPLSPYYQKRFISVDEAILFRKRQSEADKEIPSIYETTLKDYALQRIQDLILYRSEDPVKFLDDDVDLNNSLIYDFDLNGNFEEDFILDEFSFDDW